MRKTVRLSLFIMLLSTDFSLTACNNTSEKTIIDLGASWPYGYSDLADHSESSDIIAVIKITGIENEFFENETIPTTIFEAQVITPIYGVETSEMLSLYQTGLETEEYIYQIDSDPLINVNSQYLIFGRINDSGGITILGGPQGRYNYENGHQRILHMLTTLLGHPIFKTEL